MIYNSLRWKPLPWLPVLSLSQIQSTSCPSWFAWPRPDLRCCGRVDDVVAAVVVVAVRVDDVDVAGSFGVDVGIAGLLSVAWLSLEWDLKYHRTLFACDQYYKTIFAVIELL